MAIDDDNNRNSSSSNTDVNIGINDLLPMELLHKILLRLPIKHLARLKCVSKVWQSLISDPNFAESHFELYPAQTHRFLFNNDIGEETRSAELESALNDGDLAAGTISVPLKNNHKGALARFRVLQSCRGFVVLLRHPHSFIVWNPSTGSQRRISYRKIVTRDYGLEELVFHHDALLFGFGYDKSRDDYLLVLALRYQKKNRLDLFSLRTNSWHSFEFAFPSRLRKNCGSAIGLYFDGALHWVKYRVVKRGTSVIIILVFDLKERSFSEIPLPEPALMVAGCQYSELVVLGGCLALYYSNLDLYIPNRDWKTEIWVMREYKVLSSWTLHRIGRSFWPQCLSKDGDLIGFVYRGLAKYNLKGELLQHYEHSRNLFWDFSYTTYTESLLQLPNDNKMKKKEIGDQVHEKYSAQHDAVTDQNCNEVIRGGKRIKSAPT